MRPNELSVFKDPDGTLVPIDFNNLPFTPKRIFYVTEIPKGEERGNHAHYETQQIIICVRGEIVVKLFTYPDGPHSIEITPNQAVFIDKMVWDSQIFKTGNDVLLSICSTYYEKEDYIEDFNDFQEKARIYHEQAKRGS